MSDIKCPYCGQVIRDESDYLELNNPQDGETFTETCDNPECYKDFDITFECSYSFTASKK